MRFIISVLILVFLLSYFQPQLLPPQFHQWQTKATQFANENLGLHLNLKLDDHTSTVFKTIEHQAKQKFCQDIVNEALESQEKK